MFFYIYEGENFYQFTCGSFVKDNRIPDDRSSVDIFSQLNKKDLARISSTIGFFFYLIYFQITCSFFTLDLLESQISANELASTKKVKLFYRACLNQSLLETAGFDAFTTFLGNFYGGWPLIGAPIKIRRDYVADLAKYMKISHYPLIAVSVSVDPKNSSLYKLTVSQPTWFFTNSYYNDSTIMKAYRDLIVSIADNFDAKKLNPNYTNEVDEIIDLEKQLAKVSLRFKVKKEELSQNVYFSYLLTLIKELNARTRHSKNGV